VPWVLRGLKLVAQSYARQRITLRFVLCRAVREPPLLQERVVTDSAVLSVGFSVQDELAVYINGGLS